ncbi:diguanylate cyclase [Paucibacter soli]|uniref:diguanylate cyclase n=1 Tax=Paucibacter soli TaxID=3133433 RepID=UPI00309B4BAF
MTEPGMTPASIEEQLAALRAQFALNLQQTLREIRELAEGEPAASLVLEQLHARLHRLAGAGGTFGFAELSAQASLLAQQLHAWMHPRIAPADWLAFRQGLSALDRSIGVQDAAAPLPDGRRGGGAAPDADDKVRLLLMHADAALRASLGDGLSQFGYALLPFADAAAAESALLAGARPDVVLLEQGPAAARLIALLRDEGPGSRAPVVLMAAEASFAAKLGAAHAGGDELLPLPIDAPTLAASVERLLRERDRPPCRVLIVDDDVELAEHYRLVLSRAGMLAEWLSNPLDVPAALERLRPDVLLMDLYMPDFSGAELAQAIRYDEHWQGLPIVFLSAEADLNLQMKAMGTIADDFLVKPISDMQLVAGVRARTARARRLAELMSQDSLTGLLKHGSIKDRLSHELERALRSGKPVSVVMADIDFFKSVNDRWGHPTGDQVIMTLGHLLRHRLRRQDSVGRYGGEEFLAILPECSESDALALIEDIRMAFGNVRFACRDETFGATLSAGVVSSASATQAQELLAAADAALYRAKHGGRNRVSGTDSGEARQ